SCNGCLWEREQQGHTTQRSALGLMRPTQCAAALWVKAELCRCRLNGAIVVELKNAESCFGYTTNFYFCFLQSMCFFFSFCNLTKQEKSF
uniref:Uncharacterized protein n=1 Tax=Stegastes partitus TaxID=144197 RepID=A0A3B5ANU8_9TELE